MQSKMCTKSQEKNSAVDPTQTLSALTAASTRASELLSAGTNSGLPLQHYSAFMTNKAGAKTPYILQLGEGELRVLSFSKGSVKARLALTTMHAKLAPKQQTIGVSNEAPAVVPDEESKETPSWYPLKLMLTLKKSRMLFFESRRQRKEMLEAILSEQGFTNQLE